MNVKQLIIATVNRFRGNSNDYVDYSDLQRFYRDLRRHNITVVPLKQIRR